MSPSPEAEPTNAPSGLTYLYQQQRNRTKTQDNAQARGRNPSRYELGRRDRYGERVTRIYPREITKSPPSTKRYASASPTGPGYNANTSPLISALGATKTAAQYTNEWTKSLPFFTNQASPGNGGIPINGSPPILRGSPGRPEAAFPQADMSNSPPAPGMRPLSHPNHYTSFGGRIQGSPHETPGRDRRASMYSQFGARGPFPTNPPLPHQPQAHYYNLPNFDLGLSNAANEGIMAGEGGFFCGLDTLSMAGDEASRTAENVLLVGYQGGLDVFRVEKGRMDVIGRLEGLAGSVHGAKILPWTSRRDLLAASRPLIALIIHAPVLDDVKAAHSGSGSSSVIDDSSSESPSRPSSSRGHDNATKVTNYQTTVEIYSLKEQRRVAVLYKSPLIPRMTTPIDSPLFEPPAPLGEFVLDAKGKFVVVASGTSGEVFVFCPYLKPREDHQESFRCIGKVWTSVQFRDRIAHSSASSAADGSHEDVNPDKYGVPVFSLSDRWLAVTPPASTTQFPVNGTALTSTHYERPPGLTHHTVPPQPLPNCAVDTPEADSLINRLTREGTQVAIKGARWATEKGIQAFKNYMNKGTQVNGNTNGAYNLDSAQQQYFPPTHGHNQSQPRQDTVISIYDLQRLMEAEETKNKNALHALATIPAVLGCSFLSFSPSGLMLLTVSKKGDLQDVWDLKRMNFRRARKTAREQPTGPHVRQIARFARMTVTNVIDAAWSAPRIDKLAVVTDKGTVHMFLMPASAFQWPPPRRIRKSSQPAKAKDEAVPAGNRGGAVSSAVQAINGTARPFFDAVRPRNSSNGSRFPSLSSLGMTPGAGAKSGKAVAAGVGKSINNIRHAGDNKLTLSASPSGVKPHGVRWMTGKGRGTIALVAGGVLQIYRVQMRPATSKGKSANATAISKKKLVEFGLAPIRDTLFAPSVAVQLDGQPGEVADNTGVHGEWLPRTLPGRRVKGVAGGQKHAAASPAPLSFSEIETNPPYQPFYTDRRVTRFAFARVPVGVHSSNSEWQASLPELVSSLHHQNATDPWLFGEDAEAIRISAPSTQSYDSGDDEALAGVAARIENKLVLKDGEGEVEQVVVTTRRRRVKQEGMEEDEEGFFEDDCEVLDFAEDRV